MTYGGDEARGSRLVADLVERAADLVYRYRLKPVPGFDYVSPSSTAIVGYTPEEHYADPELGAKIVHPDDRVLLERLAETGPDGSPVLIRWLHKDGRLVWTEQRNVGVYDDEGQLVAIEGVARPVGTRATDQRIVGGVTVDLQHQRVIVDDTVVHTTPTEFRIVALLAARNGPVSREEIVREMWGSDYTGDGHACDGHISRLRRKIERLPAFPERLVSVRGVGYELRPL